MHPSMTELCDGDLKDAELRGLAAQALCAVYMQMLYRRVGMA